MRTIFTYAFLLSVFNLDSSISHALEGNYRGPMGIVEIGKIRDGVYKVNIVAKRNQNMDCGFFEGSGKIQNDKLIAKDKSEIGQCSIEIKKDGHSIITRKIGGGCFSFHGASCPGFEGTFKPAGGSTKKPLQQTAEKPSQLPPASASPARTAPFGEWSFLEPNGTCIPDAGFQGVLIAPGQITVHYMDVSTFKVGPPTCRNDACTFRLRGGKSAWTTTWLGPNQISFRGLHMLASENNRSVNQTSKAVRRGSQRGC